MKSRVLLVDDHAVLRAGLRLVLEQESDLDVVGEAGDGAEAIELARELEPDVVVMDITMKDLNGIEAARRICSETPDTKIVALSIHSGRRYVEGMLDAGAKGYILKDSAPEDLVEGIRAVTRGEVFLSASITGIVVSAYTASLKKSSLVDGSRRPKTRERELLRLLRAGDSDSQIAATLGLAEDSVAATRRRLMDELGVHDEAEFAEAISELGWFSDEDEARDLTRHESASAIETIPIRSTKLNRPSVPNDQILRLRLNEQLDRSLEVPITLISAPAGYGKSHLCSSWLAERDVPCAWVSLDDDDDDLRSFLKYLLVAISGLYPDAVRATRSLTDASFLPSVSVLAQTLADDLDRIEADFVLVLDDFHRIRSKPVLDLIDELLHRPPRPLHLVLITRRDPPFSLPKLRAEGRLAEVRTRDLQFTREETAKLLESVDGITANDNTLSQLERRLEGWVVGLRLVVLALNQVRNPDELLSGMTGGIHQIQDYLLQEVVAGLSPQMRDWMLKTSIFGRFCGPLCAAVCRGDATPGKSDLDGAEFLDALLRRNLFTIPIDNEGQWFRYHHYFGEMLSRQLKLHMTSDEIAELHSRAGNWFESQGLIDEAIDHCLKDGDSESAAQIVLRNLPPLMNEGLWHTIVEWLSKLPEEEIHSRPEFLLGIRRLDYIDGNLEAVKRNIPEQRELARARNLENYVAWCDSDSGMCHLNQGDFEKAIEYLEAAGARKYHHWQRAAVDAMAGLTIAYQASGRPEQAAVSLRSLREFVSHFEPALAVLADSCEIRLKILQGFSDPADRQPEMRTEDPVQPMSGWFEIPCVTRCRELIAQGDVKGLAEAQKDLQAYVEMNEAHYNTYQLIALKTLQAAVFDRQGQAEEALAALERAVELAAPGGFVFQFLELGQPMVDLLSRLPDSGSHAPFVKSILAAFAGPTGEKTEVEIRQPRKGRPPVEQLTNRELEILDLLGRRLFDKEIAAKLHISQGTVNSHCKKIYQKLEVRNRRQAVARGRDLGILDGEPS
jgi:LuxR family maltose regulon positive regulatory protein